MSPEEFSRVLDTIQALVLEELIPLEPLFLNEAWETLMPQLDAKRQQIKKLGYWTPQIPEAYGGMGLTLPQFARVSELLGQTPLGHYAFNCQAPDAGNMEILIEHGTPAQQQQWLYPLLAGEIRSCFAMTEPENPGSNPTWMSSKAEKVGNQYRINAHKWFTTAAEGASVAIAMVVTDPDAAKHRRASQIIVPTNTPGYRIAQNINVMGSRGRGAFSHAEVWFEDCLVPQENLLGDAGAGFVIAQERLGPGRIHHCMRWIGICERAFGLMCRHALSRQVAPGRALAEQQTVQNWVADSRAEINAARLMVLDAADRLENAGNHAARIHISTIKYFVANVLQNILDRALQAHGGLGMTSETPLAFWYAHERAARIYDGPDEVHKRVVARHELARFAK